MNDQTLPSENEGIGAASAVERRVVPRWHGNGKDMKTPLTFGEGSEREWYIHDADGNWIAEAVPNGPGEAEEAARRIAACVNACAGATTKSLEKYGFLAMRTMQVIEIEQQRNELLAALEGVRDLLGFDWLRNEFDTARSAIDAARKSGAAKARPVDCDRPARPDVQREGGRSAAGSNGGAPTVQDAAFVRFHVAGW